MNVFIDLLFLGRTEHTNRQPRTTTTTTTTTTTLHRHHRHHRTFLAFWLVPNYTEDVAPIRRSTQRYCLVQEAHACEQLAQSCYLTVEQLAVKPVTSRCLNHYTT